ncbi:MAG: aldo/keto reductase [Candidatus Njordarchaeales archaeon]
MEYAELGKTGIKISRIGIGTWQWGSSSWGYGKEYTEEDLRQAFETAIEYGINFIDTAEMYGGGKSEELIGEFMEGRREEVIVASKVSPNHLTYRGVLKAFECSSIRLRTDYIDLYYVHWPNPLIPMKWTAKAFLELLEQGKIRAIGVSNFSLKRMIKFNELVGNQLAANQVEYNLLHREPEKDLLPYCLEHGITLVAYSPLAKGAVLGKYNEKSLPKDFWRRLSTIFTPVNMRRLRPLINTIKEIADNYGVKPVNVVLRYLIDKGAIPIIGVKRKSHVEDLVLTFDFNMTSDERKLLEEKLDSLRLVRWRAYPWVIKRVIKP